MTDKVITPIAAWQSITSCPKDGTAVDVWAVALGPDKKTVYGQRFPNVVYIDTVSSFYFRGLPPEFEATHWLAIPEGPIK